MKEQKNAYNNWKCPECNEIFRTRALLRKHRGDAHDMKEYHYIIKNGKRKLDGIVWNKGLTKETDERVKAFGKVLSEHYASGEIVCHNKGQTMTTEQKQKISIARKLYLKEHPDKVPYVLNHHSKGDSYPEKYFKEVLDNEKIEYKQNYYQIGYFLDFAWPDKKLYLEIDGEQHYVDERIIEHDKIRTANLECEGWTCIERIRWSDYQKLNENEKKEFLQKLLTKLK